MADPLQIQTMDAKQIAELHIVERYLADQLSEEEAQAFEAYVEAHPEVTRDIENISRMKAGLATLRQRGELDSLVKKQRRAPVWAVLAASAAAVVLAIVILPRYLSDSADKPLLAVAAGQLLGNNQQPLPIARSFTIARARGMVDVVTGPDPEQAVELRLDTHAAASQRYSVEMFRVSGTALTPLGNLPEAISQSDGTVSIFVRGSALLPGNYLVRATPFGGSEVAEFALQVQGP
jgi:hypothetical protein